IGRAPSTNLRIQYLYMTHGRLVSGAAPADPRLLCTQPVTPDEHMPYMGSDPSSAPAPVPTIRFSRTPTSSSTLRTPTCAMPRAAPLARTIPSRGRSGVRATATPPDLIADLGSLARPRTAARAASP